MINIKNFDSDLLKIDKSYKNIDIYYIGYIIMKDTKLWNKVKDLIENINDKQGEYEKDSMKTKFDSDDNLPLGKILKLYNLTIVVRFAF